jgi:hypothetical protein
LVNEVEFEDIPVLAYRSAIFETYEDSLSLHDDLATDYALQSMYTLKERLGGQSLLSFAPTGTYGRVHASRPDCGRRCLHFRWNDRESQLTYSYEFTQGDAMRIHLLHQRITERIWRDAIVTERGNGDAQILLLESPFGIGYIACTRGELLEMTTNMLNVWPVQLRYEDAHQATYKEYISHGLEDQRPSLPAGHHLQHSLGPKEREHISAHLVRRAYLDQMTNEEMDFEPSLCQRKEVELFERYIVAHQSRSLFTTRDYDISHLPQDIVVSLNRNRSHCRLLPSVFSSVTKQLAWR